MLEPGHFVGNYEVVALLGEGGVGIVYRVRHRVLGTDHALKVLREERLTSDAVRDRFLAEARIQAQLRHPNILTVTETVSEPGVAGLVMDFVDGGSLAEEIEARRRPRSPSEVRQLFLPILDAVDFAHGMGVIHRDLKPENILLDRDHRGAVRPRVGDFGIAKLLGDLTGGGRVGRSTVADRALGTHGYMSPEQIRSAKDVDGRADVFSLGATMFEYATGAMPFRGDSEFEVQLAAYQGQFEIPEWLERDDPALARVLRRALQPDREQRFSSCAELAEALVGTGEGPKPSRPTPASDGSQQRQGSPLDATAQPPRVLEEERQRREEVARQAEAALQHAAERQRQAVAEQRAHREAAESAIAAARARGERFAAVGNGTVIDTQTSLIWAATDNGSDIDWRSAKRYVLCLTLGGHSDWRLATQDELFALYLAGTGVGSRYRPSRWSLFKVASPPGIRLSGYGLWASETRSEGAALVHFRNGDRIFLPQGTSGAVRVLPVRVRN